jgi:membrane protease YdiL (CAAX protease family)
MHSLLQTLYSLARVLILFSGPIIESLLERYNFIDTLFYYYEEDDEEEDGREPWHIILRNYLFAPFFEEFIFRSCFHYINSESMILSQILFGLSHIHHHVVLSSNSTIKQRLQGCILQFTYTTLFGMYTFYLFSRPSTIHEKNLWEIVAVHSLCNYLGFPSFIVLQDYLNQKTSPTLHVTVVVVVVVMLLYFTGPIAFYLLHQY